MGTLATDKMKLMYLSRRFTTSLIHAWRGKAFAYAEAVCFSGIIMNPTTGEFTRTYKEGYKERLEEIEKYYRLSIEAEFTNSELELLGIKKDGEWT